MDEVPEGYTKCRLRVLVNAVKGTDNASKGTDNAVKGADNAVQGADDAG
jgi:hypothetical protein